MALMQTVLQELEKNLDPKMHSLNTSTDVQHGRKAGASIEQRGVDEGSVFECHLIHAHFKLVSLN